jgi:hypothetical protein
MLVVLAAIQQAEGLLVGSIVQLPERSSFGIRNNLPLRLCDYRRAQKCTYSLGWMVIERTHRSRFNF